MIDFNFEKKCYGCSLCAKICPKKAIQMRKNEEGFLVPIIDKEKCINCGLCEKKCIYLNSKEKNEITNEDKFYFAYRKETDKYKTYNSSGIFTFLAKKFIENEDEVCGCIWNDNLEAIHKLSNDEECVKKMSYSKYVQSDIQNIYEEIRIKLKTKKVLFSGTPCQVAAINNYLNKNELKNLYTIAIVCHGTPSPLVWESYKKDLEKKFNSKMVDANFRYKGKYGWISPYTKYTFENGKELIRLSFTDDDYVITFGEDVLHRNSCYNCKYKGSNSNADIVIGDYWGCSNNVLKQSSNKGVNSIICHTSKGKELLTMLKEDFIVGDTTFDNITRENKPMKQPVIYNIKREKFFTNFKKNNSIGVLYESRKNKKYKIKSFLYRLYIFELIKRVKYFIKHNRGE